MRKVNCLLEYFSPNEMMPDEFELVLARILPKGSRQEIAVVVYLDNGVWKSSDNSKSTFSTEEIIEWVSLSDMKLWTIEDLLEKGLINGDK